MNIVDEVLSRPLPKGVKTTGGGSLGNIGEGARNLFLNGAPEGDRNNALMRYALMQVKRGATDEEVYSDLLFLNSTHGLGMDREIPGIVRSASQYRKADDGEPPVSAYEKTEADAASASNSAVRLYVPDLSDPIPPPPPLLTLKDAPLLTAGNIGGFVAHYGRGKSSVCNAVVAGAMNPDADTFGFGVAAQRIAYFGTEGSDYDFQEQLRFTLRRAGCEALPAGMGFVKISGGKAAERRKVVENWAKSNHPDLLILDLASDFVSTVNDEIEAVDTVAWALWLAETGELAVLGVLHDNVGSQDGRARGWLGSEWGRRAQCVFTISEDKPTGKRKLTTGYAFGKARHGAPTESWFEWSDEERAFVSCDPAPKRKPGSAEAEARLLETLRETGDRTWTYSRLVTAVAEVADISENAAKKRVGKWKREGRLVCSDGVYGIVGNEVPDGAD